MKTRHLSILLSILLVTITVTSILTISLSTQTASALGSNLLSNPSLESFSGSGSGTAGDPYIITTVGQLQEMNDNKTAYYILGNDIDASATSGWNSGAGFIPIGWGPLHVSDNKFTGTLDGKGYKITNLHISLSSSPYVGLFGYVGGAVIENVGLENENVIGGSYVGGLVGSNGDLFLHGGTITNCYSTGSVIGGGSTGGLVGLNCGTISSSYSAASVIGTNNNGGLVGNDAGPVSNCYATGPVSYQVINGVGGVDVGGLIGALGNTLSNCYSTGPVSGIDRVGGLVGNNTGGVYNSFWDNQTSGQSTSGGIPAWYHGTGKTTDNMKDVRTFTDNTWSTGLGTPWDFVGNPYTDVGNENIWKIGSGMNSGYPFLAWQFVPVRGVSVSILPTDNSGSNGALLHYTVTVNNIGNVDDTYNLTVGDNASPTWSPSVLPTSLSVAAFSSGNATLSVTVPSGAIGGTIDNIWVQATSENDAGVFDNKSCTATVTVTRSVSVSISPPSKSGVLGSTLTYTVTVNNTGNVDDTYTLDNKDNLGWTSLSKTSVGPLAPFVGSDNTTTLSVTIPSGAIIGTIDNIRVTATGTGDSAYATCTAQVLAIWTGTVTIHLENLYKVGLVKDLQLNTGSKLVVKFSKYDSTFQAESVIDSITPPQSVVANENAPQPRASEGYSWGTVQIATLVLTTDDTGNVISTIASFTVHQSDLRNRNITILRVWGDHPEQQSAFKAEAMDILRQWSSAPV